MILRSPIVRAIVALTFATTLAGCSGESRVPCHPVRGKIQFKTPPDRRVVVILNPAAGRQAVPIVPSGEVGADGSFVISTFGEGDGAPVGEYRLTLLVALEERETVSKSAQSLRERHSDPAKPIATFQVREGTNEVPLIKLN